MYNKVGEELVDADVAEHMEESTWLDMDRNIVDKSDAYDFKVNGDVTDPDWMLVMDEVGGNTNQTGDGSNGGELQMCERGKHHVAKSILKINTTPYLY